MTNQRNFKWNTLYNEKPVEEMGWYYPELDPDLETALSTRNITTGTFLDLGTGPGRQAIELAKKGFSVTGTDISSNAIEGATQLSILNSIIFSTGGVTMYSVSRIAPLM
tara:strand:- start:274 stop:600 length:327 start_codon:yes stop_codon:yes gene_type:complete